MEVFWKGQTAAQMLYSTHFMHQQAQPSMLAAAVQGNANGPVGNANTNNGQQSIPMNSNHQYVPGPAQSQSHTQNMTTNHLEQVVAAASVAAPTQTLACALCPKTFDSQISLSEHLRSHATGAKKPYTCTVCEKSFLQSNNLQTHMK